MIRNFTLTNALGASFSLMNAQQGAFFEPQGLGFDDATQYEQVGEFFAPLTQRYGQQVITGSMVFGSQPYEHYLTFTKFCQHAPLSLVYETDAGTFQIPCRLTKIEKGDTDGWTYLNCKVEFTALARLYKTVVANNTGTAGGGKVYLAKDLPDITGSIITIDNAEAGEVLNITADINPIQDLHGYDAPWVGGAGVNKWDEQWENGRIGTTGENQSGNGIRSKNYISVSPSTQYHGVSGTYSGASSITVYYYDTNKDFISLENKFGMSVNFTTPNNCYYMRFNIMTSVAITTYNHDIAINYPSTVTTYSPYSNICPISGHTEVTVTVADDADDPTVSEDYTTALGRTVYGGTLDLVSGELTVTWGIVDMGDLPWTYFQNNVLYANYSAKAYGLTNMICSIYQTNAGVGVDKRIYGRTDYARFYVQDSAYTDANTFKTAVTGQKICFELATPQTYQLTPQQIQAVLGNVWANSGDITITGRKTYGYKYDYTYGNFVADTVTIDSDSATSSPCRITIFGECTQPTWRHYLDGNSVATGYYNGTIPSGHKLVIDTTSSPYSIEEQDIAGNLIADRYELCDFSTERFFLLEYGHNTISVSHTDPDSIRLMVEGYIFYETV